MKRILFLTLFVSLMLAGIAGADVSGQNAELIEAAAQGNLMEVEAALIAGADINTKDAINGTTALMLAAQNGCIDVVRLIIEKGADVNAKKTTKDAAVMISTSEKDKIDDTDAYRAIKRKIIFKLISDIMDVQLLLTKVNNP